MHSHWRNKLGGNSLTYMWVPTNTLIPQNGPLDGFQGVQDAHGLPLLVPGTGGVGVRSQSIRYSASGSPNESANTPYNPVGGPQVPKEAHGNHLFVPGANGVGQIIMIHGYKHRAWAGLSNGTTFTEIGSAVRAWLNQIGRSVCDLYI